MEGISVELPNIPYLDILIHVHISSVNKTDAICVLHTYIYIYLHTYLQEYK